MYSLRRLGDYIVWTNRTLYLSKIIYESHGRRRRNHKHSVSLSVVMMCGFCFVVFYVVVVLFFGVGVLGFGVGLVLCFLVVLASFLMVYGWL